MPGTSRGMTNFAMTARSMGKTLKPQRNGFTKPRASPLLARKERLEGGDGFLGAHALAEQMALLVDPAGQVLGRRPQQLARDCDRFGRQRADFARHLARLGLGAV